MRQRQVPVSPPETSDAPPSHEARGPWFLCGVSLASGVAAVGIVEVFLAGVSAASLLVEPNAPLPRTAVCLWYVSHAGFSFLGVRAQLDANVTSARFFRDFNCFNFVVAPFWAERPFWRTLYCGFCYHVARCRYQEILAMTRHDGAHTRRRSRRPAQSSTL